MHCLPIDWISLPIASIVFFLWATSQLGEALGRLALLPYRFTTSKWNKITLKCILDTFFVCTNGYIFNFLQLLLFCEEILLENYPVWQLTMLSCSVVKQNFPNTNIIVNYCYFNFYSNWQLFVRCWAYKMKWIAISNTIWEKYTYFCDILKKKLNCTPKMYSQKSIWM